MPLVLTEKFVHTGDAEPIRSELSKYLVVDEPKFLFRRLADLNNYCQAVG